MPCNYNWKDLPLEIKKTVWIPLRDQLSNSLNQKFEKLVWHNITGRLNEIFKELLQDFPTCTDILYKNFIWFDLNRKANILCEIRDAIVDCNQGIVANDDSVYYIFTESVFGESGYIIPLNILENDTIYGQPATTENVTITILEGVGNFLITAEGILEFKGDESSPSELYTLVYQICDINDPSICDTATVEVACNNGNVELLQATPNFICSDDDQITVTITGLNFHGTTPLINAVTNVFFDGVEADSFTIIDSTTIEATTPIGVTSGEITVTSPVPIVGSPVFFDLVNAPIVNPITGEDTALCMPNTLLLATTSPGGTWSSSDDAVATVLGGTVTGVSEGTATISYSVTDLGCTTVVTQEITVNEPVVIERFTLSQTKIPTETATFIVEATGTGLTYQWFAFDGIDFILIDADFSYDGEDYLGFNSDTLTVLNVSENTSGLEYNCVVTGISPCSPETTTPNSILNVGDTGIESDPLDREVCVDDTTTFEVVRQGLEDEEDITYSWEYDAEGTDNWLSVIDGNLDGMTISNSTTSILNVADISLIHNGYRFRAVVTGTTYQAFSNPATLTVNEC